MIKRRPYILAGCAGVLLLIAAAILAPALLGEKEPDRTIYSGGGIQVYTGEVLFISKHEDGYVIYMDQREYEPNRLMEFWIHDETRLVEDDNEESLRKMLEEQETGRIVKIGCFGLHDNLLDGHDVHPVVFMYDKTPKE